jgi:hypothetical protein
MKIERFLLPVMVLVFVCFLTSCGGGSGSGSGGEEETAEMASLHLSSVGQPLNLGDAFTVKLSLDTDDNSVTAVSAYIIFPSDLLEVASIDTTDSNFSVEAENVAAGNVIKITRGEVTPGVNSINATIAKIAFIARAPGRAHVSFQLSSSRAGPSRVIKDDRIGTDILTTAIGETYTIQP